MNERNMNNRTRKPALTKGEEEVMQALWQIGSGCVNDIIARMKKPAPKYTTVATFIKILEDKGYVAHEVAGKSHRYFPLVEREAYARSAARSLLDSYFDGSLVRMVSCFPQKRRSRCARWSRSSNCSTTSNCGSHERAPHLPG